MSRNVAVGLSVRHMHHTPTLFRWKLDCPGPRFPLVLDIHLVADHAANLGTAFDFIGCPADRVPVPHYFASLHEFEQHSLYFTMFVRKNTPGR